MCKHNTFNFARPETSKNKLHAYHCIAIMGVEFESYIRVYEHNEKHTLAEVENPARRWAYNKLVFIISIRYYYDWLIKVSFGVSLLQGGLPISLR